MRLKLLRLSTCIALALAAAGLLSLVTYLAYRPSRWEFVEPEALPLVAAIGALFHGLVPSLVLGALALYRPPNAALAVFVASSWPLGLMFFRASRLPQDGDFPWWMLQRDVVQQLPVALALGLAFAVAARNLLKP
jgi:hypothetical protein